MCVSPSGNPHGEILPHPPNLKKTLVSGNVCCACRVVQVAFRARFSSPVWCAEVYLCELANMTSARPSARGRRNRNDRLHTDTGRFFMQLMKFARRGWGGGGGGGGGA